MEIFVGWLIFSILVGWLASSRGRSGFGFFVVAAMLSPLIGLVIVLVLKDLKVEDEKTQQRVLADLEAEKRREQTHARELESIRAVAGAASAGAARPSVADELVKLAALRDSGVLSAEEFETQKRKALGA